MQRYSIGLDFGTGSVRALMVDIGTGEKVANAVWNYEHGTNGVILSDDPNLARQHPADYVRGAEVVLRNVVTQARRKVRKLSARNIVGIGVAATGSTPLPVDKKGWPLAFARPFVRNPAALAWLWKDHTSADEAEEITDLARRLRPHFLAKCGGVYSSEWFFSKILHAIRTAPEVFDAAALWVELADWIPAILTGTEPPEKITVGVCAAGHKAMYNDAWGGYPDGRFLGRLHPKLARLRLRLKERAYPIGHAVGGLTASWAKRTGLREGIPVSVGAIDAHLGAVGAGIEAGTLVRILGTSACDMMVVPLSESLADVPGLCGIVPNSILPGFYGLEAGQPAVGDIFNWLVHFVQPGGRKDVHGQLSRAAARLRPGASGLLALDWNNGNRSILVDGRLTGLLVGHTLSTTPAEVYRALIEATAFGSLVILQRLEEYGVRAKRIIACGGIAEKNPLVLQIYADVLGRAIRLPRSGQSTALGAAIAGAVAGGAYRSFRVAQEFMCSESDTRFRPDPRAHSIYKELYILYRQLHDAFGTPGWHGNMFNVMKQLLEIRAKART